MLAGLFMTTLATLSLEILDTRLLSVLTWYHLSFFAVSVAMLGMAAGAIHVYLGGSRFAGEASFRALARAGLAFALSIPISHLASLCIPIPVDISTTGLLALVLATLVLATPFCFSGVVVTIVLTRIPGQVGLLYAVDLLGAALGSLLVLPLLTYGNISSAALVCGSLAAVGAACFRARAGQGTGWSLALGAGLVALALCNIVTTKNALRVTYPKGQILAPDSIAYEFWSIHGQVVAQHPFMGGPPFWGPGEGADRFIVEQIGMAIDGAAGTVMTRWNGDVQALEWIPYDVTALPYELRQGGDVAVIGVGGGRDVLAALWAGSRSVTGIEINHAFLRLLEGPLRDFAGLADRPEVHFVHDEARSYLTRDEARYDVLQMSLIDTWAATGAGAFTLSENGLYTLEAWDVLLQRLKPEGILSVSRWYAPTRANETSRLLALGTAALIRHGVADAARNLALVARDNVATLMVSTDPLSERDVAVLQERSQRYGFELLLAPGVSTDHGLLSRIVASRSLDGLRATVAGEPYDYMPPTDGRPYFFNLLKLSTFWSEGLPSRTPGVLRGNLFATATLGALLLVVTLLVATVILGPLLRSGLPSMKAPPFVAAILYFSLIGTGFMLIQIGFIQRFSVYLGHPTYSVAIILFSMIVAAGIGSLLSELVPIETRRATVVAIPLLTAALVLLVSLAIQPLIDATIHMPLVPRCLLVITLVAPPSLALGMFFPTGLRLVARISSEALPWMWGVNGACGVLASVVAVAVSMWLGIQTNFVLAVGAYASIAPAASFLWRWGAVEGRTRS